MAEFQLRYEQAIAVRNLVKSEGWKTMMEILEEWRKDIGIALENPENSRDVDMQLKGNVEAIRNVMLLSVTVAEELERKGSE